jgi:hypothetical protein
MKTLFYIASFCILASCSSKDDQFCACLEAGEKLNNHTVTLFDKEVTPADEATMKKLKTEQEVACKDYQLMDGAKMLEQKAACEEK